MSIKVTNQSVFHLQTDHTSYIFNILENGELGHLYYGKKIHAKDSYPNLGRYEKRGFEPYWNMEHPEFQPSIIKQEYSGYGKGDFRNPAYQVRQKNGSRITELRFNHFEITKGKLRLRDLPSTFSSNDDDVETLSITLKDDLIGLEVILNYSVFPHEDVIVRNTRFINKGNESMTLLRAFSAQLDLPDSNYDFIHFSGAWLRERQLKRTKLRSGIQSIDSLRVSSSPQQNPFFMLARKDTNEIQGEVIGFNFIYSGNFTNQIEVDHFDVSRVLIGINPEEFEWNLHEQESFETPEVIISYTDNGFNKLSQQLATFYKKHLVNPNFADKERPILVNNWEATYFDFDSKKLLEIAYKAKELGIELFVIDDGWFGHRTDDTSSLGDWVADLSRLPEGLGWLSEKIHDLGLEFGLWFEPEMISMDSQLYKQHPDWVISAPGRTMSPGRKQFVLDFSRDEVVNYIYESMAKVIEETKLNYIKWDMNRHITDLFSCKLSAEQQMELSHRYILGVYKLYQKLIDNYPNVLFESCSSGGGRFDLGMMYYAPQAWTSDDTDAIERLKIQFGTSYGYSLSMMGAHVSAVPSEQSGRMMPMKTRADVAYFGDLGYELDITQLSKEDEQSIKDQIEFYKKYRPIFQQGCFYRLQSPFEGDYNLGSWQVVSEDKTISIAGRYQILNRLNPKNERIYFMGLDPEKLYTVSGFDEKFYGDELMNVGINIEQTIDPAVKVIGTSDFKSDLFIIEVDN